MDESWPNRSGANGEVVLKPDARCSLDTANVLLAAREKELLPAITLIHNCPILTEDGPLKKGYHPACGGRLIKSAVVPAEMSLPKACKILLEAIAEFDFLEESDKSRAMAAIISPALRFGELLPGAFSALYGRSRSIDRRQGFPAGIDSGDLQRVCRDCHQA